MTDPEDTQPTADEPADHEPPLPPKPPGDPDRLAVIIASEADAGRLIKRMVHAGLPATKVGSTGGFLRRGNATIFSGVPHTHVPELMRLVREECRARREVVPVQSSPFFGDTDYPGSTVKVRIGGATVFILDVMQFEQS